VPQGRANLIRDNLEEQANDVSYSKKKISSRIAENRLILMRSSDSR
jgi:hypothetical protein